MYICQLLDLESRIRMPTLRQQPYSAAIDTDMQSCESVVMQGLTAVERAACLATPQCAVSAIHLEPAKAGQALCSALSASMLPDHILQPKAGC